MEENYLKRPEGKLNQWRHVFLYCVWLSPVLIIILNQKFNENSALMNTATVLIIIGALIALPLNFKKMGHIYKGEELIKTGPYGHCRNPFYLGQVIFLIGFALLIFHLANIIFISLFIILTHLTVKSEEKRLEKKFGHPYRRYFRETPRYLPRRPITFLISIYKKW